MFQIKQSEATAARRRIPLLFVSSTDGFTPVTPTSPVAYISQNGATWVATTNAPAVATLAGGQSLAGVYYLELTATEVANLGWITVNVQASNARQYNAQIQIQAYDPYDVVRLGVTALPNVATGNAGAVATGDASGRVTVITNSDKTGYSLTQAFPTNFASMAITAGGAVTAGTVSDKTGYSLTQTFPANFGSMAISVGGAVTAGTVSDKTGYSLATAPPTASAIATQVWSEALPGTYTSGQAGFKLNAAGSASDPWSTALPGAYSAGSAGYIIGNNLNSAVGSVATNVWSVGTRTLTSGANIVLTKGTGITGFNDITALSVWDVLASTVSVTGSMGLQVKTNVDTTISSRLATSGYTAPPTASTVSTAVWSDLTANYSGAGFNGSFGKNILRADAISKVGDVTLASSGGTNRVDADVHAIQNDTGAVTSFKNMLTGVAGSALTATFTGNLTGSVNSVTDISNIPTAVWQADINTGYVSPDAGWKLWSLTGGGGGGAGGMTEFPSLFLGAGTYTVTVGAGGSGGVSSGVLYGTAGSGSLLGSTSVPGGGAGGTAFGAGGGAGGFRTSAGPS